MRLMMRTKRMHAAAAANVVVAVENLQRYELRWQLLLLVFVTVWRRRGTGTPADWRWRWTVTLGQVLCKLLLMLVQKLSGVSRAERVTRYIRIERGVNGVNIEVIE